MKVALVQCPGWGRDCPPYTMALLSAILKNAGHLVFCFDINNSLYCSGPEEYRKFWDDKDLYTFWSSKDLIEKFIQDNEKMIEFQVEQILNTEARIVGFTVHFSSLLVSLEIAKRIKEKDKKRLIVFGGPDCCRQLRGPELIKEDAVDIVNVGEGDRSILELVNALENDDKVDFLKGTLVKKNGSFIDCGDIDVIDNLNTLPFPDYSDFTEDILSGLYRQPERLEIFDSRGCVVRCHFCSEWQFWRRFRTMSGERIFREVSFQTKKYPQVDYFYFIGSLLNGSIKVLSDFCDLLIKNGLKIRWLGQAIISEEMTPELLQKMRKAGCEWLGYGIESGSQRIVDKMNKKFSLKLAQRVLRDTHDAGIQVQANFMFGLPTETEEDFKETLNFLKRNRDSMDSILASQSFCVIDKDTYLYNHADEFGITDRQHHLYWEAERNTYPERFRRYEEFCKLALSLGIPETSGVLRIKPDKWVLLGDYYFYKKDYKSAIESYSRAAQGEIKSRALFDKLGKCYEEIGAYDKVIEVLNDSLQLASSSNLNNNSISDASVLNKSNFLKNFSSRTETITNYSIENGFKDFSLIESEKLAKILQHFSVIDFKRVDLEKILSDFKFNEKQKSMSRVLYSHGLWKKLSNYILADVQKARKEPFLFSYPYWLVIDPCNYCHLLCPFCPTGQRRKVRMRGQLRFEDFKNIIDNLGPYLIHIDLVNWGEPLLNEYIYEMIKYAKQYHPDIKIDTNLLPLNEDRAKKIILSGLDKIVVSIDGLTEETYSKYRRGGNFIAATDNLKLLIKKRKELKSSKPYITWQFLVFRHNEHEIEEVKKFGKKLGVDHVGITKAFIGDKDWVPLNHEYSNYSIESMKDKDSTNNYFKVTPDAFCNWPWEALIINPNGSVSVCCSVEEEKDDFGNIFDQPFEELWNDENYQTARKYIKDKKENISGFKNICMGCQHLGLINIDILSCHSFFDLDSQYEKNIV